LDCCIERILLLQVLDDYTFKVVVPLGSIHLPHPFALGVSASGAADGEAMLEKVERDP
jgi:hypothetical protein